jgi:hypothetical protein
MIVALRDGASLNTGKDQHRTNRLTGEIGLSAAIYAGGDLDVLTRTRALIRPALSRHPLASYQVTKGRVAK